MANIFNALRWIVGASLFMTPAWSDVCSEVGRGGSLKRFCLFAFDVAVLINKDLQGFDIWIFFWHFNQRRPFSSFWHFHFICPQNVKHFNSISFFRLLFGVREFWEGRGFQRRTFAKIKLSPKITNRFRSPVRKDSNFWEIKICDFPGNEGVFLTRGATSKFKF